MKIIYYSYVVSIFLILFLNLNANITFGNGLGDVVYLATLVILTILYSIIFFRQNKVSGFDSKLSVYIFTSVLILTIVITALKLTVLRGSEYPWNGDIFLH